MTRIFFLAAILISSFSNAQTLVPYLKKNGKYIYVDSATMRPVITREFGQAWLFEKGVARVNDSRDGGFFSDNKTPDYYIDKQGRDVKAGPHLVNYPFDENGHATVTINGKEGLFDKQGKQIIPAIYDQVYGFYDEPLCLVKEDDRYGLVNKQGQTVVLPKYISHSFFYDGLIFMQQSDEKWGAIDTQGKVVIPFVYDDAGRFRNGHADVVKNGKTILIDKKGNTIPFAFNYDEVGSFGNGLAPVKRDELWGFVNYEGIEVIPTVYDSVGYLVTGDRVQAARRGKWGLIDQTGKRLAAFEYDKIHSFNDNLYTPVIKKDKQGIINKNGKLTVPVIYDNVALASQDIIMVKKNGKWGAVEAATGKIILPIEQAVQNDLDFLFPRGNGRLFLFNGAYRTAEGKVYRE